MPLTNVLLISNLSHNFDTLVHMNNSGEINPTELYGSGNLPLGVLSIEAYINKHCKEVSTTIIDLNAQFMLSLINRDTKQALSEIVDDFDFFLLKDIKPYLLNSQPKLVVISTLFDKSIPTLIYLSRLIRNILPEALIVAGGHPVHNLYKQVLQIESSAIDAVCMGEGEIPIANLINSHDWKNYISNCEQMVNIEKIAVDSWRFIPASVSDLDSIPQFDYSSYFSRYGSTVLTLHSNLLDATHSFNKQAIVMTSRGCPYHCVFCAAQRIHGHRMRAYSIQRVKEEIDYWVDVHQVRTLGIMDDHFLFDIDRAIEIIDYAGKYNLDIRFLNGLAVAPINQAFIECLVRNNIKEVHLAIESGSNRVLKEIIHKPLSILRAEKVLNMFKTTNIFVKLYLVVGFLNETISDIEESLDFLRKSYYHWALISTPTPISGSQLFEQYFSYNDIDIHSLSKVSFFDRSHQNLQLASMLNGDVKYTVNLDLNFVHNPYMRMGEYQLALDRFSTLLRAFPNHAFAIYYSIKCMEALGEPKVCIDDMVQRYQTIIESDPFWRSYAMFFDLPKICL